MLKRRPELHFVTILISIDKINRHVRGISYQDFISDETTFGFVIRNLQEIGEAVRRLLDICDLEGLDKDGVDWRKIVDFRNVVVHKYFGTEPEIIFAVANKEVPFFEKQILSVLQDIRDKAYLLQAIEMTIPIYEKMHRKDTVDCLRKVLCDLKTTSD